MTKYDNRTDSLLNYLKPCSRIASPGWTRDMVRVLWMAQSRCAWRSWEFDSFNTCPDGQRPIDPIDFKCILVAWEFENLWFAVFFMRWLIASAFISIWAIHLLTARPDFLEKVFVELSILIFDSIDSIGVLLAYDPWNLWFLELYWLYDTIDSHSYLSNSFVYCRSCLGWKC